MEINQRIGECPRCHGPMSPAHVCDWSRQVVMPGRQCGKTDAVIKDLQAQLDAVTRERDALRAKLDIFTPVLRAWYHAWVNRPNWQGTFEEEYDLKDAIEQALGVETTVTVREVLKP